jgi:hypothetical protein
MCQLCDEANAYLAQLEAASKKPAADERKGDRLVLDAPQVSEDMSGIGVKIIAQKARVL